MLWHAWRSDFRKRDVDATRLVELDQQQLELEISRSPDSDWAARASRSNVYSRATCRRSLVTARACHKLLVASADTYAL